MNAAHHARLLAQILAMAKAGHVDFNILEGRENPAREHQRDHDEAIRHQEDWWHDRWRDGGW